MLECPSLWGHSLGLRSHPSGWLVPETPSTSFSFIRSDRTVYATALIRSSGPCQPSTALAGSTFLLPQESLSTCSRRSSRILRTPPRRGGGAHMGDSQISGAWTHTDHRLHINCLELKVVSYALRHWAQMLQGLQFMIATDNSTVVSYINKQGGSLSLTLLRLTV